jgi:hypothetical protein
MCSPGLSRRAQNYLRVAHTYMLISIPTCTSTIFGVFQAIRVLQNKRKVTKAPAMFRSLGPACETRASARLHHCLPYVAM